MHQFHDNHAPDSEAMYKLATGGDLNYPYAYIGMFDYRNEECGRSLVLHSLAKHPLSFVRQTEWGGNSYAFVQDVVEGQINSIPITVTHFQRTRNDLYTNAPRTVQRVSERFAADPNLQLLEPFHSSDITAADADLQKLRTRFLMFVPPRYVPIVLDRRLTPRELWTELVGAMVARGDLEICSPLVEWVLLTCIRTAPGAPSSARLPAPHPPLADADFIKSRQGTLYWHLPMLRPAVIASLNESYIRKVWNFVCMNRQIIPAEPPQNEYELTRYIVEAKVHALWKEDHVAVEDEEDAITLGAALLENKHIQKVDFRLGHNFTRPAAEALARAMRLSNITSFSLQLPRKIDRDYQEEKMVFFQALAPLALQEVLFECLLLTNQDAHQLCQSLHGKRLVKIRVELGPDFNEQGATALSTIIRHAQDVKIKGAQASASNVRLIPNRGERERAESIESNIQGILCREGIVRSETMQSMNIQFMSIINAIDLAAALQSLHVMRMECCGSYVPEMPRRTLPGIQQFSTTLRQSTRLESLYLENCYFGHGGMTTLLEGLKHNRSIVRLTLARLAIGNADIQTFCENWSENSCIQDMVLSGNDITVVGARQMLRATLSHPTLKSLDLSSNRLIGNHGLQTLAEDVLPQLTLRLLKLGSCGYLIHPHHMTPDQVLDQKTKMSHAMLQAARRNVRMHFLLFNLDDILPQVDAEIALLLSTNRLGRFLLRDTHGLGPAIWTRLFAKRKDDPSVIFCFLREQPTLAMFAQKRKESCKFRRPTDC